MSTLHDAVAIEHIYHDQKDYKPGDIIQVPKHIYDLWIDSGIVKAVEKAPTKTK